jgi:hypothetical protein
MHTRMANVEGNASLEGSNRELNCTRAFTDTQCSGSARHVIHVEGASVRV